MKQKNCENSWTTIEVDMYTIGTSDFEQMAAWNFKTRSKYQDVLFKKPTL